MTKEQLKKYCEAEFENIDAVVSEVFSVVQPNKLEYSTAELAAIAAFIHNFYNGIENILKKVLTFKHIEIKETSTWHKELLKSSFTTGIITSGLYDTLSNYLSFRHFFVHSYSFVLRWEELKPLVDSLEETLQGFKSIIYSYFNKLYQ